MRSTEETIEPSRWVPAVLFLEASIFPLIFLIAAGQTAWGFLRPLETPQLGRGTLLGASAVLIDLMLHPSKIPASLTHGQVVTAVAIGVVRPSLIVLFNLLCAGFIAFRTRLQYRPTSIREVWIPTLGTFLLAVFPLSAYLPSWFMVPVAYPPALVTPMLGIAAALVTLGSGLSIYALSHLRRNFSVFVEVRDVVLSGPYRWIRHPMYTGEILLVSGVVLTGITIFGTALLVALIVFQTLRALMEEKRLAAADPSYAAHMQRTGRFLPKLLRG